jgi:alkylmercury lyase-like protein
MTHPASIAPDALRIFVYDTLIETGTAPDAPAIGVHFGVSADDARRAVRGARIGKTLLAHPDTGEIWMAGPFAGTPTSYRVVGRRTSWWANCAWDMLGIPVIVGEAVEVHTTCTDCGAPLRITVDPRMGPAPDAVGIVHFLVPASRWYDDIGFT